MSTNTNDAKELIDSLTPTEKKILERVARGHITKDIAKELCISARTVQAHLNSIYLKLLGDAALRTVHPRITIARIYFDSLVGS